MNSEKASAQSRRTFLKKSSLMAAAGAAAPWALQLAAMGEAAAFSGDDYKALVCVFLYGGNDYANTVVTYDEGSHRRYADIRAAGAGSAAGGIVLSRAALANTVLKPAQALPEGRQYALHPSMPNLAGLFNSGQAGVQLNVGPLVVPLTRQQFESQAYPMPPKLFSHNDQQSLWQSSSPEGSTIGWGGRLGDIAMPSNSQSLFTCISVTGNSVFLSGQDALQYQCSTSGAIKVRALQNNDGFFGNHTEMRATLLNMMQQNRSHVLQNEYNNVMRRALAAEGKVSSALSSVNLGTAFADNNLSRQMRMVARLIGARQRLGVKRQVFMVSLGGFDLHDNLVARQPGLLQEVDQAISTFYKATVELGVSDKVTTAGGRTIFWWAVRSKALDFMVRRHPSVLPTARTHKTNGMSGRADCCPEHLQTSLPRLLGVGSVWRRANLRRSCPICEILENRLDGWTTRRILASCNCRQPCDAEARRHVRIHSWLGGRCILDRARFG